MSEPLSSERLLDLIVKGEHQMDHQELRIWDLIRIEPNMWRHKRMKDVWVVGIAGTRVLWHDHWENGFQIAVWRTFKEVQENVSTPSELITSIKAFHMWIDGR